MKTILKRSIATSLLLLCLSLCIFADGDMGAGSKSGGNGGGLAPTIDTQINTNNEKTDQKTLLGFIEWFSAKLAETFGEY